MLSSQEAKAARVQLQLSQADVAAATGINRTYISLFEGERYVLDGDSQSTLRSFYEQHGYDFGAIPTAVDDASQVPQLSDRADTDAKMIQRRGGPVRQAMTALEELEHSSVHAGIDSKRTVAALAAARDAVSRLDYSELLSIAHIAGTTVEHLPLEQAFAAMPIAAKEIWEERASCTLLCDALYGDDWLRNDPRIWTLAGRDLLGKRMLAEDGCPRRPFFGGAAADQKFIHRARAALAPAIVRAAGQRRGPALTRLIHEQ